MPSRLSKENLVARPDRIDFRDRMYQPPLRSLVDVHPPLRWIERFVDNYVEDGNILDQGEEGACTGFGLAAVVNYVYWARWVGDDRKGEKPPRVSPHMFYRNARVYDEWEGTDYEGSSCRGAMKGWFKHGVCKEPLWPDVKVRPHVDWSTDAAWRPLGAYYRVDAKSIADMQAAIYEVSAVYCSAEVHSGWDRPDTAVDIGNRKLPLINPHGTIAGGHAFALVGYTNDGFIVQNSWGPDWGYKGFALLSYEDWIKNGNDAWVAALGAPMRVGIKAGSPVAGRRGNLMAAAVAPKAKARQAANGGSDWMWTEAETYEHSVVMGNDGKLVQRLVNATSPADALDIVAAEHVAKTKHDRIAIYVHGGLNSEEAAINRARRMGPWFETNGIHPIFVIWRTGILESIGQIGLDEVKKFEEQVKSIRARGLGDMAEAIIDKTREAFDRAFEVSAEKLIGKAVWSQMKQNAAMAVAGDAGMVQFIRRLAKHKEPNKPIYLLGHSAGSIMIGHMLDAVVDKGFDLKFESCELYAPACTMAFAAERYGRAFANGTLKSGLHIDILTDKAEVEDCVGPYGKSLLYLVSRALEDVHKMPLLGLQIALEKDGGGKQMKLNEQAHDEAYKTWLQVAAKNKVVVERHAGPKIKSGPNQIIQICHGSFDNDLKVFNGSLRRMLGRDEPIQTVTDLTGF